MANGWTPERRQRQAELVRGWRPWEQATGPTTEQGKAVSAMNAWRGGVRGVLRDLAKALRADRRITSELRDKVR